MSSATLPRPARFAPIEPTTLGLISAVVGVATWMFSSGTVPAWLPPLWSDTNAMSRDSILFVGPIVAGVGAWIGGWRHTLALGPAPARGWNAIVSAQLRPLAAAILGGHLLGLAPAIFDSAAHSTGGSVNPLAILAGGSAILAVTCLGYLLGTVWSSRIAPVAAALAVLPAIVGPILISDAVTTSEAGSSSGAPIYGVALSWLDLAVGIGRHETLVGAGARLFMFTAVGVSAALAAISAAGRDDRRPHWSVVGPFAAPALVATAILLVQPPLVDRSTDTAVCEPVPGSQICVAPEIMNVLPSLAAGAAATTNQFGYGAATLDIEAGTPLSDLASFRLVADSPEQSASEAAITTSRLISGEFACLTRSVALAGDDSLNAGGELELPYRFASELSYAIAIRSTNVRSGVDEALFSFPSDDATTLAAFSNSELRAFLDQHATQLANCEQASVRP